MTKKITIDEAYEQMLRLTKYAFPKAPIQAFEITHSYCPGTYDLSIHGKNLPASLSVASKMGFLL